MSSCFFLICTMFTIYLRMRFTSLFFTTIVRTSCFPCIMCLILSSLVAAAITTSSGASSGTTTVVFSLPPPKLQSPFRCQLSCSHHIPATWHGIQSHQSTESATAPTRYVAQKVQAEPAEPLYLPVRAPYHSNRLQVTYAQQWRY